MARDDSSGFLAATTKDHPAQAASIMVSALFLLALQDGLVKLASTEVSIWQFQMIRSAINLALLLVLSRILWGSSGPKPRRLWAVALRSFLLVATMICFFGGVPFLSLAEIAAGLYVFPFFVAILAAALLGERVGPRRIGAILLGFCGTLLIMKPGTESFKPVALMPVGAAFCYACMILTTRRLCRSESPVTLTYGTAIAVLIVGAIGVLVFSSIEGHRWAQDWPYLFTGWRDLELWILGLIAACSGLNVVATISLAKAYQNADASWLAPFDYSYLIFATFWGFVFWRHLPDGLTVVGMAMIAAGGAFVAWRERQDGHALQ